MLMEWVYTQFPLLIDVVAFLRTVNGITEVSEGSSVILEVVLQGQVQENTIITYQLDFEDETATSKMHNI